MKLTKYKNLDLKTIKILWLNKKLDERRIIKYVILHVFRVSNDILCTYHGCLIYLTCR